MEIRSFGMFNYDTSKRSMASLYLCNKGDEVPLHSHPDHGHSSFVVSGSFELFDDKGNVRLLKRYDNVPQFTPGRAHGFRAMEDGSALLNTRIPGA